jgi:hypothetical protein
MFFSHSKSIVVRPEKHEVIVVGPSKPIVVSPQRRTGIVIGPQPRGVWNEQGWNCSRLGNRHVYEGFFRATNLQAGQHFRFEGRIIAERGEFLTYIANPPPGIRHHPKGACFAAETPPWFRLHWHHAPQNVDEAILYMEKVLSEVLN